MGVLRALIVAAAVLIAAPAWAQPSQPNPNQQNEFVPMKDIPPQEQLPAPKMVAAAYGFAWVAILAYLWSVHRRVNKVEAEIADLERRGK